MECFANGICYSDNHKIEFARLMAQAHKHLQKQQQSNQINSACFPGKSRLASYPLPVFAPHDPVENFHDKWL